MEVTEGWSFSYCLLMKSEKIPMEAALKKVLQLRKRSPQKDRQQEVLKNMKTISKIRTFPHDSKERQY